jgi:2-(3-amino-3-carboxypropyl)histidine synthase
MALEEAWIETAISRIRLAGAGKVFVQAPEGLKTQLQAIGTALEKAGIEVVLSCEPCFGACDLKDAEAKRLGCELLLHIGHADFGVKTALPVIYEDYPMEADPVRLLEGNMEALKGCRRIGLLTTVQYLYLLEGARSFLSSKGKLVFIGGGKGNDGAKPETSASSKGQKESAAKNGAKYAGQLLGCDQSAATSIEGSVDAFLFMGTGRFHTLGLLAATKKPVFFLDFEGKKLEDITPERDRLMRIKFANIEKAKNCNAFGVIISTKPGQAKLGAAMEAKKKLEAKGKHAWLLAMDAIAPEKLLGLKLDCLVNCACPRLAEDAAQFRKPMIGPEDVDKI